MEIYFLFLNGNLKILMAQDKISKLAPTPFLLPEIPSTLQMKKTILYKAKSSDKHEVDDNSYKPNAKHSFQHESFQSHFLSAKFVIRDY